MIRDHFSIGFVHFIEKTAGCIYFFNRAKGQMKKSIQISLLFINIYQKIPFYILIFV